jgi:hypothetical protein
MGKTEYYKTFNLEQMFCFCIENYCILLYNKLNTEHLFAFYMRGIGMSTEEMKHVIHNMVDHINNMDILIKVYTFVKTMIR